MTAKRWQIVCGWAFLIANVTIFNFVGGPFPFWSWWTLVGILIAALSYQAGAYFARQWQEAGK